jgi:outer membrane lipoprotein-sorting protein
MQREKDKSTRALIEFTGDSDARVIFFAGNRIRMYFPKLKLYQDYDVGKSSDVLNQYLLLGFGSSGSELAENYEIIDAGVETIAGKETTKLELMPKSAKVKETLAKVDVWIPQGTAYPVQQQFFKPSGDYFTMQYSNIQLNPPVKGSLEFKLPKGATKQGS